MSRPSARAVTALVLFAASGLLAACIDSMAGNGCVGALCLDATAPDASTLPSSDASDVVDAAAPDAAPELGPLVIRPAGGMLVGPYGILLAVPPGAVDHDVLLTVRELSALPDFPGDASAEADADAGAFDAYSKVYSLEPAGVVFARPVTISMPLPSGHPEADLYWQPTPAAAKSGAPTAENVGGLVAQGRVTAEIISLAAGYLGPAQPTRTVLGTALVTRVGATSFTNGPEDTSGHAYHVWTGDLAHAPENHEGIAYADGTFRVPGVPDGPFVFADDTFYLVTAGAVDMGRASAERSGGGENPTTRTAIQATGLPAYASDSDRFQFTAPQNALYDTEGKLEGYPREGSTTTDGLVVDLTASKQLFDGTQGDRATLALLQTETPDGGAPYSSMTKAFDLPASYMATPGITTAVDGALRDVTRDQTFGIALDEPAIRNVASAFGPQTSWSAVTYGVYAVFGGTRFGAYPNRTDASVRDLDGFLAPTLVEFHQQGTKTLLSPGPMLYGDGYPGWGHLGVVELSFERQYRAYDEANPGAFAAKWVVIDEATKLTGSTVGADLQPPTAATLDGEPLVDGSSTSNPAATLAWTTPPRAPSYYAVTLYLLDEHLDGEVYVTYPVPIATVHTPGTSLILPPGFLQPSGARYFFRIAAVYATIPDAARAPNRLGPRHAYASYVSGALQTVGKTFPAAR